MRGDPRNNKDYRNNPSLLIQFEDPWNEDSVVSITTETDTTNTPIVPVRRNILIDVGKTFRETAIRWMPRYSIQSVDAVLLTHHHMDAVAGLDDLRGFQRTEPPPPTTTTPITSLDGATTSTETRNVLSPPIRIPIPIYASHECWDQVSRQFPWLVPDYSKTTRTSTKVAGNGDSIDKNNGDDECCGAVVHRDVAALKVNVISDFETFHVYGLRVTALPVWHGDDLICLGFAFSLPLSMNDDNEKRDGTAMAAAAKNVVYLSDISRMKEETLRYIQTQLPPTDIFIVDALLMEDKIHPVHFNLHQAVALAKELGAKKTLLVGMGCDSFLPHDEMNAFLREHYKDMDVSLAYDGLLFEF